MDSAVRIPAVIRPENTDLAVAALADYFHSERSTAPAAEGAPAMALPRFTGSRFDDFGRETGDENTITAADLLSLSFLSVEIGGDAVLGIMEGLEDRIGELLASLPTDVDIHELDDAAFERQLGPSGTGQDLWNLIRGRETGTSWGMGPTRTSKLLARKRPRLIPIWDSFIGSALGMADSRGHWARMRAILRTEGVAEHLDHLRREANVPEERCSLLRVFDVTVWYAEKYRTLELQSSRS
ncbi:DUF6308 family protein [Brachybacterium huguangmaarense]